MSDDTTSDDQETPAEETQPETPEGGEAPAEEAPAEEPKPEEAPPDLEAGGIEEEPAPEPEAQPEEPKPEEDPHPADPEKSEADEEIDVLIQLDKMGFKSRAEAEGAIKCINKERVALEQKIAECDEKIQALKEEQERADVREEGVKAQAKVLLENRAANEEILQKIQEERRLLTKLKDD